jgi:hypothetical protein
MTLGIWTNDVSSKNLLKLYMEGFRGLSINPIGANSCEGYAEQMFLDYSRAKQIGFTHFLIQMYSKDPAYQDAVISRFKSCTDVEYLFGEPYNLVEKEGWNENALNAFLNELRSNIYGMVYCNLPPRVDKQLICDIQLRLWDKVDFPKAPSSYFWQQRVWYKVMPFVWIFGQLAWHSFIPFIGSLCYKRLKRKADVLNIKVAYCYEGNEGKFDNLINGFLRKRFVRIFNPQTPTKSETNLLFTNTNRYLLQN